MSSTRASASVIAAGIVAILGSCLTILGLGLGLMGMALIPSMPGAAQIPDPVRSMMIAMLLLFEAIAVFGVFTGVGVLRLKNWARISAMVFAGITVFFGSFVLLFTMFMPLPTPPGESSVPVGLIRAIVFVFYGVPVAIGIWWLVLFNRATIRTQFSGEPPAGPPELPPKPRCPLPIAAVAGFLAFAFVCTLLAAPFYRFGVPALLFGHMVRGYAGLGILVLAALLMLTAAIGLWRLKGWSYPLILGLQLFWLLSGTVTFLSPSYVRNMQEILSEMQMAQADVSAQMFILKPAWMLVATLLFNVVVFAMLLYYRSAFLKAARAAEGSADRPTSML